MNQKLVNPKFSHARNSIISILLLIRLLALAQISTLILNRLPDPLAPTPLRRAKCLCIQVKKLKIRFTSKQKQFELLSNLDCLFLTTV